MSRGLVVRDREESNIPFIAVPRGVGWIGANDVLRIFYEDLRKTDVGFPLPLEFFYGNHVEIEGEF